MKNLMICGLLWALACGLLLADPPEAEAASPTSPEAIQEREEVWHSLPHGVRYRVLHEGDGTRAALWASVYVHYRVTAESGVVLADTYTDREHGRRAHKHVIGSGTLAEALEMAVSTMRERDRRVFEIPAELFNLYDFHGHGDDEEHNDEEHEMVLLALKPGSMVRAEISLLWVRPYDPANFNRFRFPGN